MMGRPMGSKNSFARRGRPGLPRGGGRARGRPPVRPRRYSNSTVASVDLEHVKYLPETTVLKPVQSVESDHWPIFVLLDAIIYRKTKHGLLEQANACNVDLEGPFVIRGKLDVDLTDPEQADAIRNYTQTNAYIEISSSRMYSVGWTDDTEEAAIWSAGTSGWFEILPAPEYRAMHDTVREGVTLYYLIQEIYEAVRKRAGKGRRRQALMMPIEQLLKEYAIRLGDGLTLSEAKERCQKHAPFLLAHFSRDQAMNWKATSFQKWMTETNATLCQKLLQAEETRKTHTETEPLAEQSSNPLQSTAIESDRDRRNRERSNRLSQESDVEMMDAPPPQEGTRVMHAVHGRAVVPAPATPTTRNAHDFPKAPSDPVHAFLEFLEELWEELPNESHKITPSRVHSRMYIKCSTSYNAPKDVSRFYARQLAARLPSKWVQTPYFQWLVPEGKKPWRSALLTPDMVPLQLKRRKKTSHLSKPKGRESDGTSTPHMGKRLPVTPRTGALTLKRPRPRYQEGGYEDDDPAPKHARTLAHNEEEHNEEENSEDEQANDSSDAPAGGPDRAHPSSMTPIPATRIPKETVPIVVRAEKIPTVSPAGPNGAWRCAEDGCDYIVRSAEQPDGKLLIDEHFQDHADRVEKVNLALAEGTRGNLPINHLLKKIRSMGEASRKKEQGADGGFPEAIKRRLIL